MRLPHVLVASLTIAAATLAQRSADAQLAYPTATFDAITSYGTESYNGYNVLVVTGVQHGAGAPSTMLLEGSLTTSPSTPIWQTCEKNLLVAINRPGRFSFKVGVYLSSSLPPLTGAATQPVPPLACTLTQLP